MAEISNILIFISGLLGPVLGIMLADYYVIRKRNIDLAELYRPEGAFHYYSGFNPCAMLALFAGVAVALIGYFVPALDALYKLSWFSGFVVSFGLYWGLMGKRQVA